MRMPRMAHEGDAGMVISCTYWKFPVQRAFLFLSVPYHENSALETNYFSNSVDVRTNTSNTYVLVILSKDSELLDIFKSTNGNLSNLYSMHLWLNKKVAIAQRILLPNRSLQCIFQTFSSKIFGYIHIFSFSLSKYINLNCDIIMVAITDTWLINAVYLLLH